MKTRILLAAATCSLASPALGAASFHVVGNLGPNSDGVPFTRVTGLSADGTIAVGWSNSPTGQRAIRWTLSEGLIALDSLPGNGNFDRASAISPDGSVIVGASTSATAAPGSIGEATVWSAGGPVGLGFIAPGAFPQSGINDVAADNTTFVGLSSSDTAEFEAARWVNGVPQSLGTGFGSSATGVSADGSVIVGSRGGTAGFFEGFVWTETGITSLQDIAFTPPFDQGSTALAISDDATTIVGWATDAAGQQAVKWDLAGNVTTLGSLTGFAQSRAEAVSSDGSVIVGSASDFFTGAENAFIWTESQGMVNLNDLLHQQVGAELDGWTILSAEAVSGDGSVISGTALSPDGVYEGYVATIPAPGALLLLGAAAVRRTRRRS